MITLYRYLCNNDSDERSNLLDHAISLIPISATLETYIVIRFYLPEIYLALVCKTMQQTKADSAYPKQPGQLQHPEHQFLLNPPR
jgi:hypothetical protein